MVQFLNSFSHTKKLKTLGREGLTSIDIHNSWEDQYLDISFSTIRIPVVALSLGTCIVCLSAVIKYFICLNEIKRH